MSTLWECRSPHSHRLPRVASNLTNPRVCFNLSRRDLPVFILTTHNSGRWKRPSGISPISSWTYFSFWLTVFCTLASLLPPSFSLFPTYEKPHLPSYIHSEPTSRAHRLALTASLYRPNIYIGLERLNSTIQRAVLPEKLDVFPHVFQPVSKNPEEIGKVWSTDGRARVTFNGLVSPEESKVIINKDVSLFLILQGNSDAAYAYSSNFT